jgi:hypothetical protein
MRIRATKALIVILRRSRTGTRVGGCCLPALIAAVAIIPLVSPAAVAQSLEDRVASAPRVVAFEFTTRANVCGDGRSVTISDDSTAGWMTRSRRSGISIGRRDSGDRSYCERGPARVVIDHDGRRVRDIRVTVGGSLERVDAELGIVPPADAARYLLGIAPRIDGTAADDAIMGAAIAADVKTWPRMLEIARDNNASESARKSSLFWVSQEATTAATAGLGAVAMDDDAASSVRSDALFFLAQRKAEGVPALIRVVNESKSIKLRKDAIWFLSQSRDPRAIDLFEKLLSGR